MERRRRRPPDNGWIAMIARLIYGPSPVGVAFCISGVMSLWWAWALLIRDPEMLTRSNIYHALSVLAPASFWGSVALVVGALQVAAWFNAKYRAFRFVAVIGAMWWGIIAGGFWAFVPPTTGEGVYTILALTNVWAGWVLWQADL